MEQPARVLAGGRLTLPKEMREHLDIKVGDYVTLKVRNDVLEIVPVNIVSRRNKKREAGGKVWRVKKLK